MIERVALLHGFENRVLLLYGFEDRELSLHVPKHCVLSLYSFQSFDDRNSLDIFLTITSVDCTTFECLVAVLNIF